MKKIFTLMTVLLIALTMQAEEKTVWEGSQEISWNTDVAPGIQFETANVNAEMFKGLAKDDIIRIYTTTTYEEPQYVVTYKAGDGWEWTDLETTFTDGIISYQVTADNVATEIAERGLIIRGQAYTITKITIDGETPEEPVVPAGEQTVWEGSQEISWNTDVAPGIQFETTNVNAEMFKGLAKEDIIRIYTTTTYEEPQYVVTYKAGDGWEWTDLETTVTDGIISYQITADDVATEIAERGLIIRGQAYTIVKITVTKPIVNSIGLTSPSYKGNKNGVYYTIDGRHVVKTANGLLPKGLYIVNGKKVVVK